jgi:hypothetical protein
MNCETGNPSRITDLELDPDLAGVLSKGLRSTKGSMEYPPPTPAQDTQYSPRIRR